MIQKPESRAAEPMLIKRYAGHRLYNTATLTYATPDDLRALARKGRRVIVRDARSGDDITDEILARPH
jgi:polyhydroxyalkanoate synthesis regulator protein